MMQISPYQFEPLVPSAESGGFAPITFPVRSEDAVKKPTKPEANIEKDKEQEEIKPPAPQFSESEMEAAKEAAYQQGFHAGKEEAQNEINQEVAALQNEALQIAKEIQQRLPELHRLQEEGIERRKQELGKLVLHCSGRISLEALKQNPLADIEKMVRESMEVLMGKEQLVVKVHPRLLTAMNEIFGNSIKLKSEQELSPGDCLIQWENGYAERRIDDIWFEIETIIDRYFSKPVADEDAEDEWGDSLSTAGMDAAAPSASQAKSTEESGDTASEDDKSETVKPAMDNPISQSSNG